ncbi:response regulator [Niveispirillum irakense]|uniref:response regulator n=1 Tax=Niveispirillum irakense TaxID=34011 RepID=UPI00068445FC|nr:response regulator transcription factor [Niveispirillum irakense]
MRVLLTLADAPIRSEITAAVKNIAHIDLVGVAGSLRQARSYCLLHDPDVLVIDLDMPDGSGLDLIRECRRLSATMEIMVISPVADDLTVLAAIEAGATSYLDQTFRAVDLIAAIDNLSHGHSPVTSAVARIMIRRIQQMAPPATEKRAISAITDRERDVLWGLAKGYRYSEIATILSITKHTVISHVKSICRKLQVNSRSEAVFVAISQNIIYIKN